MQISVYLTLNPFIPGRKLRYFKATHAFRDSYVYNNLMYGLMTYVSEVLEGQAWEVSYPRDQDNVGA